MSATPDTASKAFRLDFMRLQIWIGCLMLPHNACHHQAAEGFRHRGCPLVAALVHGIVSGYLCGPARTLGGVHDEQVQRQLFHFLRAETQVGKESP